MNMSKEMAAPLLCCGLWAATSWVLAGGYDVPELEHLHASMMSTPEGKVYENKAVTAFWGDASFLRECVADAPSAPVPLTIFFVVAASGELEHIRIDPDNDIAKCIVRHTAARVLPKPPPDMAMVVKIELGFK